MVYSYYELLDHVTNSDVPDPDPDFFFHIKIRPDPDIRQKWQYPAGSGPG